MSVIGKILNLFIESSKILGLNDVDIETAKELLDHREYGLCFDTTITQIYECNIEIDDSFYSAIVKIANKMSLPSKSYSFMKELVREKQAMPPAVKEKIASINEYL